MGEAKRRGRRYRPQADVGDGVENHQAGVKAQQDGQRPQPQPEGPRPEDDEGKDAVHEQGRREEHRLRHDDHHGERSPREIEGGGHIEAQHDWNQEPDAPRTAPEDGALMRHD
jgi:hypothetical protein